MKILNAIHAQSIGGVDQMFRNYTKVLIKNNHEVALLISNNSHTNYDNLGVKKIYKLNNSAQIFDFLKLLWIVVSYRPDIVICHSNRLMRWIKTINKLHLTKSVAVNHGISFKNSLNCDYIININEQINRMVVDAGHNPNKSFVLENVIKVNEEYSCKKISDKIKIGIYARIEERKGFDILIQAVEILLKKDFDIRLKIGGFDVEKKYCLQTVKDFAKSHNIYDNCEFVGLVTDKKSFFNDVDIFCVPSREEPFGLVILEGFHHSTLVISSDTVGGKLLIKNNEDGILFKNENFVDLANKIEEVLKNKENYCNFTKKAYEKLRDNYSFNRLTKNFEEILTYLK